MFHSSFDTIATELGADEPTLASVTEELREWTDSVDFGPLMRQSLFPYI